MKDQAHPEQLAIDVPEAPNTKPSLSDEDKARLYALEMGAEAAARQQRLFAEALTECTCGIGDAEPVWKHEIDCHCIPLKSQRRRR